MQTRIAFALFVLSIVVAGAQEKKLAAKLVPPLESHGQPITNCGCTRDYVQDTVHGRKLGISILAKTERPR